MNKKYVQPVSETLQKKFENENVYKIFSNLRDIQHLTKNNELIYYFKFLKFYGLLDPKYKNLLDEIELKYHKEMKKNIVCLLGIGSLGLFLYYKPRSFRGSYLIAGVASIFLCYYTYEFYRYINYMNYTLLEMKDEFLPRLQRFENENHNILILNPNFLTEEISDPDIKFYQKFMKAYLIKYKN